MKRKREAEPASGGARHGFAGGVQGQLPAGDGVVCGLAPEIGAGRLWGVQRTHTARMPGADPVGAVPWFRVRTWPLWAVSAESGIAPFCGCARGVERVSGGCFGESACIARRGRAWMHSVPPSAGSRAVFVQFRGGGEVGVVKWDAPVTVAEVASLPVVLGPVQAGRLLGLGRTTVYRLLRGGTFPVPVRRVGRSWVVPTAGVLTYLGLATPASVTPASGCGCGARVNATEER
ncbi:helix-turn-helix transcriptional regulator [Nocardiopsis lambiniae]|uniref:Helix-turn-helix domain-containing protein n=1 Tax=Nocardiopsis lambiniae TaxID=3075539 RepID=A0ABU2MI00_9ACTN|nr:helix-turn-helix domain-containing protein [Nocardiopsis sp. DSM 44743]MDT0331476.1 helix-turn-helix domain-containing protein [Nocardiopsis sp. DSM 44743]